jgi:hypothetical protein
MEKQASAFPCFHYNRRIVWKQKTSLYSNRIPYRIFFEPSGRQRKSGSFHSAAGLECASYFRLDNFANTASRFRKEKYAGKQANGEQSSRAITGISIAGRSYGKT